MKFEILCEKFGVHKQVKREFYPKQIEFSPDFLTSLEKEFHKQTELSETPVKNCREKFLKALNFHLREIEKGSLTESTQDEKLKKEKQRRKKVQQKIKKVQKDVLKQNLSSKN
jgi:hypothetical protein